MTDDKTIPSDIPAKKLTGTANNEILSITALAVGLIAVGTCNADVNNCLLEIIRHKAASGELMKETWFRMLSLGLALPFLCQQAVVEPTAAALTKIIPDDSSSVDFRDFTLVLLDAMAYAATGNVLKIQKFLHICSESTEEKKKAEEAAEAEKEEKADKKDNKSESSSSKKTESSAKTDDKTAKKDDKKKDEKTKEKNVDFSKHAMAVMGIGLVATNEDVGAEMAQRVQEVVELAKKGENTLKKTPHQTTLKIPKKPKKRQKTPKTAGKNAEKTPKTPRNAKKTPKNAKKTPKKRQKSQTTPKKRAP